VLLLKNIGAFRHTVWFAIGCALTLPLNALPHADRIIVHKKDRTMELMYAGQVIRTYKVALGRNPVGPKQREGDFRTPEGKYVIDSRNAKSQCHRSLHISYPNAADRDRARKLGMPWIEILPPGETPEWLWLPRRRAPPVGLDLRLHCCY
jgi:hypothetical protein